MYRFGIHLKTSLVKLYTLYIGRKMIPAESLKKVIYHLSPKLENRRLQDFPKYAFEFTDTPEEESRCIISLIMDLSEFS